MQKLENRFCSSLHFLFLTAVIFNFVFFRHDSAEFKPA